MSWVPTGKGAIDAGRTSASSVESDELLFVRGIMDELELVPTASRQGRRSYSTPMAVWYRSSAVLASSFITMAETADGTVSSRSLGATGCLAMGQWTHSIGSEATNGRLPVS